MKRKSIFNNLPFWEHIKITHLLDPMHIFKNVSSYLWRHISWKQSETFVVRKDPITSKNKRKHWLRKLESTGSEAGAGPSTWYFKEGDVPWIFKKYDLSLAKEVIMGVRVPSSYGSSLQCFFKMEDHSLGLKSHDHLNLLRVRIMSKAWFYYLLY